MTGWVGYCRLFAGIVTLALFGLASRAEAAAGRTAGSYAVTPTGAATYTIPIWTQRGPNGLQPHISLTYSSQSGLGYLGMGWSLSGLSAIYRCPRTYAQDSAPAPITLTTSDVFCIDGQRLRLTSGTYGVAASTYQTEVANFSNVTAFGSAGAGPAYFIVQGRDGLTYEYGNGGSSQVLLGPSTAWTWWLDKVTDRAGNTTAITYKATDVGSAVPDMISWTPSSHGVSSYNYTMAFAYGTTTPPNSTSGYVGGKAVSNTHLLSSITVNYTTTTVKKYVLSYEQSPTTGRDRLSQVKECADAGATNCLAPTQFTYQNGQIGVSTTAVSAVTAAATELKAHNDFNGDGYNDLTYCAGTPAVIFVAFASASGYASLVNTGIACTNPVYGELMANGKDGILAPNGVDWWYYTWNGTSFAGVSTGLAYDATAQQYMVADVNGDGLPDLIAAYQVCSPQCSVAVDVRLNTGSGTSVRFSATQTQWYTTGTVRVATVISNTDVGVGTGMYGTLKALDFNGDGRQDLVVQTTTSCFPSCIFVNTYELISTGSGFTPTLIATETNRSYTPMIFANLNSDGCTDYTLDGTVYISGCNGTVAETIPLGVTVIGAMDWDGDGLTDLLVQNGATIGVYLADGDGISAVLQGTSIPYSSSSTYFAFDANGDGLDDLGAYASSGTVSYYPHNGSGQMPDLMSSATDGYGNYAKPTYVSMAQAVNSTYFAGTEAQFPYKEYMGPLYIVSQTTFNDPSNAPTGTYQRQQFYARAWMNLQGRGFAGFENVQVHDTRTIVWDTLGYGQAFPYTGMLISETAKQNNSASKVVLSRSYALDDTILDGTSFNERHFPHASSYAESDFEVGGLKDATLITKQAATYSYDSFGNLKLSTQTVTDEDSGSPYFGDSWTTSVSNTTDPDSSTWCLGLLSASQVSYTASDGSASVTRTRDYVPDLTNCRYTQVTTEPLSSTYKVTEELGYDGFGNINSDTITGISMVARLTTADWGSTGQFPITVTDAASETTQFNYDFRYGLVSSQIDANGLPSSWVYGDGFARLTQATRPDGTYTTYRYVPCDSSNSFCGYPDLRVSRQIDNYATDGSVLNWRGVYTNSLDAIRFEEAETLSGTEARIVTYYDALGRMVKKSMPYISTATEYDTTYGYDALNRLTAEQRPISQSDSTLQTTSYDYEGRTTNITDPQGHGRALIHDVNGWLRQTTDALGYAVTLGYDAAGAKTSVRDNLGHILWTGSYGYGLAPYLTGETDIDRGAWGYTVDALGERTAWTDPKAETFSETYDALSRPLTRTEPDLFTQWTWGSSAASFNIGKLQSVCSGIGTSCGVSANVNSYTYDDKGRLISLVNDYPAWGSFVTTWQYNTTTGLLDTLTYPRSTGGKFFEVKYGYQNGILQSITDILDSPNITIWTANAENAAGQVTQATLGNGLVTTRAYDAVTYSLQSVQTGPGGGASVQNQSFLYDEVGNIIQRQDTNLGLTENFYYDDDYRLSHSTLNGTQNLSLTYDPMGNITSRSDVAGGAMWTYDPTHVHEVTQAGGATNNYVYDANGNVKSRGGFGITWSSYNYPTFFGKDANGETVGLSYDDDRRVYQVNTNGPQGLEQTVHAADGLFDHVKTSTTVFYRHYIYAGAQPVAIASRSSAGVNTIFYLLSDHQGSVATITDNTGAVVVGESFAAFGGRRSPTTWSGAPSNTDLTTIAGITRHGYTFQAALGSLMGLNDMVGRVQDAVTGRFLSGDPSIPDPTDPQDYNRYSYTNNNPLTFTDPTGFAPCSLLLVPGCDAPDLPGITITPPPPDPPPPLLPPPDFIPPVPPPGVIPILPLPHPPGNTSPSSPSQPSKSPPPPKKCSMGQQCDLQQSNPQQPPKPTQCPNGMSPSRANNPNVGRNIGGGMLGTGLGIGLGAAFIASQFIGVGEVADVAIGAYEGAELIGTLLEAADAGGQVSVTVVSGLNAGAIGAAAGAGIGLAVTAPTCP